MTVYALADLVPDIAPTAWIAPGANVIGQAVMGEHASVWFGVTVRADNAPIRIGARSNIQENSVLHVDPGHPIEIGENVTVGHQAMLHGCTIGHNSLIGIQSVIMNGAVIGENSLVGAGALVTEGKQIPPGSLVLGSPAKVVRALTEDEISRLRRSAQSYVDRAAQYRRPAASVVSGPQARR
ncbi:MAG: gamma carbonic anhydrase family protein [Burkholderiaceae bacterium]